MMWLLAKIAGAKGLAAHIPDLDGKPLCKARLNFSTWRLQETQPEVVICYHCRRVQAKKEAAH